MYLTTHLELHHFRCLFVWFVFFFSSSSSFFGPTPPTKALRARARPRQPGEKKKARGPIVGKNKKNKRATNGRHAPGEYIPGNRKENITYIHTIPYHTIPYHTIHHTSRWKAIMLSTRSGVNGTTSHVQACVPLLLRLRCSPHITCTHTYTIDRYSISICRYAQVKRERKKKAPFLFTPNPSPRVAASGWRISRFCAPKWGGGRKKGWIGIVSERGVVPHVCVYDDTYIVCTHVPHVATVCGRGLS